MQKPIIGCCGLTCSLCGAHLATQKNSDEIRRKVAEKWSEVLKIEIKPEQINCDGCTSDGRLFFYCQICDKRRRCMEKHIENCAYCKDYPCRKLDDVFKVAPYAKATLDDVRRRLSTNQKRRLHQVMIVRVKDNLSIRLGSL